MIGMLTFWITTSLFEIMFITEVIYLSAAKEINLDSCMPLPLGNIQIK